MHFDGEMEVFEDAGIYNFCVSLESEGSVEIHSFEVIVEFTDGTAGIHCMLLNPIMGRGTFHTTRESILERHNFTDKSI